MADYLLYSAALLLVAFVVGMALPLPLPYHPTSFVAAFCRRLAAKVHPDSKRSAGQQRLSGGLALLLLLTLPLFCWFGLFLMSEWPRLLDVIVLLCCFSWPGYRKLGYKISTSVHKQQLGLARSQARLLLRRNTKNLSEMGLAKALIESLSLHFHQQVTALICWYLVAGAPGVLLCRLTQIASQQWSAKNSKFQYFGKSAASLADFFNSPAYLLGAMLFWLQGLKNKSLPVAQTSGEAFSGTKLKLFMQLSRTLRVSLGGPAQYDQDILRRQRLQQKFEPSCADIQRLLKLLDYQFCTLLVLLLLATILFTIN